MSPAVVDGVVFLGSDSDNVYALGSAASSHYSNAFIKFRRVKNAFKHAKEKSFGSRVNHKLVNARAGKTEPAYKGAH